MLMASYSPNYQFIEQLKNAYYPQNPAFQIPANLLLSLNDHFYSYVVNPIDQKKECETIINNNYIENKIKNGIVNHIIGSMFILQTQKKIVPIKSVNLDGDDENKDEQNLNNNINNNNVDDNNNNNNNNNVEKKENNEKNNDLNNENNNEEKNISNVNNDK